MGVSYLLDMSAVFGYFLNTFMCAYNFAYIKPHKKTKKEVICAKKVKESAFKILGFSTYVPVNSKLNFFSTKLIVRPIGEYIRVTLLFLHL